MDNDQRIILTLVLAVTILIILLIRRNARVRERDARRARRRGREPAYAGFEENLYDNESDLTFRRLFRMSKLYFTALLNALYDDGRLTRSGLGHSVSQVYFVLYCIVLYLARRKARAAAERVQCAHSLGPCCARAARNLQVAHRALGNGDSMCRPVQHIPGQLDQQHQRVPPSC